MLLGLEPKEVVALVVVPVLASDELDLVPLLDILNMEHKKKNKIVRYSNISKEKFIL